MALAYFPIIVPLFALAFVWFLVYQIRKISLAGEKAMVEQSDFKKKYKAVAVAGIILFIALLFLGWKIAVGFLLGALASLLAGFLGMVVLNQAQSRMARAKERGPEKAMEVSFNGAVGAGLATVSLALLVVSIFYFLTKDMRALIGLAFGASLISFFTLQLRSGQGKVGDIFETYSIAITSTIILGAMLFPTSLQFVLLPLILGSVSILASIVASFFKELKKVFVATIVLSAVAFYFVISKLMPSQPNFWFLGFYGVALLAISLLSIAAFMAVGVTAKLKKVSKIYAIVASGLVAITLFLIYFQEVVSRGVSIYSLDYTRVIAGILLGAVVSSLFVLAMGAARHRKILLPGLIIIFAPILVGFLLGAEALGGLLVGGILAGFFTAISTKTAKINPFLKGICLVALLIIPFLV